MLERVAHRYADGLDAGADRPGALARALGVATRHPIRTAATAVIALATVAIVANAAFLQTADHPSPWFGTAAPNASVAPVGPTATTALPTRPDDAVGRLVQLTMVEPPQVQATAASPNVVEVQRLLAAQGYDPGIVDGLFGARTRGAIEAYQRANGLPVTGAANAELVGQLRRTGPAEAATAVSGRPSEAAVILAVQTALNQSAYGPIAANGIVTAETTAAIRNFQLDNGLSPTGRIDDALTARMIAIGALDPL